ncbi:MAG TPA: prepilin-type N-terminal cleavage/methylation domain-containing protein [Thermoleophilia bacterium]|nr:prepilin-type N-terminal cleavage/methylation domain-containing protein [Thermoleophilia bacterium]
MSTSRGRSHGRESGFSLIELLIGLSLTLCVAAAALTLWTCLERTGTSGGDRMIRLIQGRVAVARLSRDLRLATAWGCPFPTPGVLLEARANQVVILTRSTESGALFLVEWELIGGSLMRRRGNCPATRPASIEHSLFVDHKTMLEGVTPSSRFRFFASGAEVASPVCVAELQMIDEVRIEAAAGMSGGRMTVDVFASSRVGR